MLVIVAPNAYKGSLSPAEASARLADGIRAGRPEWRVSEFPISDGGQGFAAAVVASAGGRFEEIEVEGPLGEAVKARYGLIDDGRTGVIEMASASGLTLLEPDQRDPLAASTFGTGQIIKAALNAGCARLIVGIGGSATNDGGAGMAEALGVRLLDSSGRTLPRGGGALGRLSSIDISHIHPRVGRVRTLVACDVTNPLCGPEGASAVYGPQKGATPADVEILNSNLCKFATIIKRDLGVDVAVVPGSGAAGGLGAGLMAFLGAELISGIEIVCEFLGLGAAVAEAGLVVTGEGRLDAQTLAGKGPLGVARLARASGVPVVAVAGQVEDTVWDRLNQEFDAVIVASLGPASESDAMMNAGKALKNAAESLARLIGMGMGLRG